MLMDPYPHQQIQVAMHQYYIQYRVSNLKKHQGKHWNMSAIQQGFIDDMTVTTETNKQAYLATYGLCHRN